MGALKVKLREDDLKRMDEVAPLGVTKGSRYPEASMSAVNR